jgi:hypothetical protein
MSLSKAYFIWRDTFYEETTGLPIWFSTSGPCAQAYMQPYEHKAVTQYNTQNPSITMVAILQCWFRQADDTFTSLHAEHIEPFDNWLNSIHPDIQWTYKIEKDGKLNMLNLTVIRAPDGSLSFVVYRKPTHTGQYIPHDSHAPRTSMLATVRALTRRADRIPSTLQAMGVSLSLPTSLSLSFIHCTYIWKGAH